MNTKNEKSEPQAPKRDVLKPLRSLQPTRRLRGFEHLQIAERQATELHSMLKQTGPPADLAWLMDHDGITVVLVPRWKMDGRSGMSTWTEGQWVIGINRGNPHARRRFTLCHEFKHVLDASRDRLTYQGLSDGQREQIADYFAACSLMPKTWVRRAWTSGIQDPEAFAGLFNVSLQAMERRLRYLGFIEDEPDRPVASYFRFSGLQGKRAA